MTLLNLSASKSLKTLFPSFCHCVTRACTTTSCGQCGDTPCQNAIIDTNNNINDLYIIVSPGRGYCVTPPPNGAMAREAAQ